jgi:hypothetical protein
VCEAFYPEKTRQIASLNERILRIEYSFKANAVVAVGTNPYVFLIPV